MEINMGPATKKLYTLVLVLSAFCMSGATAVGQVQTTGYVTVQASPNPSLPGQGTLLTSALTSCIQRGGNVGSLVYYVSTSPTPDGQSIGLDSGNGVSFNPFTSETTTYYIYGAYTYSDYQTDSCAQSVALSA